MLLHFNHPQAIASQLTQLPKELTAHGLIALVDNAGIATPEPVAYQRLEDLERMFRVNAIGAMDLARACLPLLGMTTPHAKTPKTRYAPVAQRCANWTLPRLLPERTVDSLLAKAFGLETLQ